MFSDIADSTDAVAARTKLIQNADEEVMAFASRVGEVISDTAPFIYTQGALSESDQMDAFDRDRRIAFVSGLRPEIRQAMGKDRADDFDTWVTLAKAAEREWTTYNKKPNQKKINAIQNEPPKKTWSEDYIIDAITKLTARMDAMQQGSKGKPRGKPTSTAAANSPGKNAAEKNKPAGKEKRTCYKCHRVGHLAANCKLTPEHLKVLEEIQALEAVTSEEGQDF